MITIIENYKECENLRGSLMYIRKGLNYKCVEFKTESGVFEEGIYAEIKLNENDSLLCATL